MAADYSRDELDQILDWAHHIAGEPVSLRRAIKMWEARQQAVTDLKNRASS